MAISDKIIINFVLDFFIYKVFFYFCFAMNYKVTKHFYSIFFSLILIFSMNFRGFAGYVDYLSKIQEKCYVDINLSDNDDDDSNTYTNTNSSEENENQGSNMFEILEKINKDVDYCFKISEDTKLTKDQVFYHLDLYSLLKPSLNTPPPEVI